MTGSVTSPSLVANPRLSTWITVRPDGRVLARSGKVELGQGILAALTRIVADQLEIDPERVEMVPATTAEGPDESYTAGSLSVQHSGGALRQVCAEVRAAFLEAAAERLGAAPGELRVDDGTITGPGPGTSSYWELAVDVDLAREATGTPAPLAAAAGPRSPVRRADLPGKLAGLPAYVHDLRLPGQLHGRVVRPPGPGSRLQSVDDAAVRSTPGVVAVVVDGSFVGVVAEREPVATAAADALARSARWDAGPALPDAELLHEHLRSAPASTEVLHRREPDAPPPDDPRLSGGRPRTVTSTFTRPYLAHASIGPSCAVARWDPAGAGVEVWSHSQGIHNLRRALAAPLDVDVDRITVAHVAGAGCYGHNGADDAALDAALLARAVPGRPVRVLWSRVDEMTWSPLAPAMVVEVSVDLDDAGRPCRWRHDIWSDGHSGRPWSPGHPPLLAATHLAAAAPAVPSGDPPFANGGGAGRNSVPAYDVGAVEVTAHRPRTMALRTSAMRALGAHLNVYAIEGVVDELAAEAGVDAVQYRLELLSDPRARRVIQAAADAAGWADPLPDGTSGRGIGFARYKHTGAYCAVVAEVTAEDRVRATRLTVAADIGEVIDPVGAASQLEGGALQAVSWTLLEQVRFDAGAVTTRTWEDYPILRFSDVPDVEVLLVGERGVPPVGAGEASVGPTAAALGNALASALGVRVRRLPLTATNVLAAIG